MNGIEKEMLNSLLNCDFIWSEMQKREFKLPELEFEFIGHSEHLAVSKYEWSSRSNLILCRSLG